MTVKRVWHGWTTKENADKYQSILLNEVLPGIEAKRISGYRGIEVVRREQEKEVEFVTIMTYDSLENIKLLQGENYKKSYVPPRAQEVLKRWDKEAAHYEVVDARDYEKI